MEVTISVFGRTLRVTLTKDVELEEFVSNTGGDFEVCEDYGFVAALGRANEPTVT